MISSSRIKRASQKWTVLTFVLLCTWCPISETKRVSIPTYGDCRKGLCYIYHSILSGCLKIGQKKATVDWNHQTQTDGKLHPDWQIEREERGSKKVGRVIEAENLLWASGCWQPKWMVSLPCPLKPLVLPTDVRPASNSQSNSLSMTLWATLVPLQLFQSSNLTSIRTVKWKCTKNKVRALKAIAAACARLGVGSPLTLTFSPRCLNAINQESELICFAWVKDILKEL